MKSYLNIPKPIFFLNINKRRMGYPKGYPVLLL
jgi:hypothetical protein